MSSRHCSAVLRSHADAVPRWILAYQLFIGIFSSVDAQTFLSDTIAAADERTQTNVASSGQSSARVSFDREGGGINLAESLQKISSACKELERSEAVDFLTIDGFRHREDAEWLLESCRLLGSKVAAQEIRIPMASDPVVDRNLADASVEFPDASVDFPWYADVSGDFYPWITLLVLTVILIAAVVLWEIFWAKSTMCSCFTKCCSRAKPVATGTSKKAPTESDEWGEDGRMRNFWEGVATWHAHYEEVRKDGVEDAVPYVLFAQRKYRVMSGAGKVVISLLRQGPCDKELVVKVKTAAHQFLTPRTPGSEDEGGEEALFAAKAGRHFEHMEKDVTFAPGESIQHVEVVVKEVQQWGLAKMFHVEIVSIVSGSASMYPRNFARIFVVNQYRYPAGADESCSHDKLWIKYFKEWIPRRGFKFWKTLRGLLYVSFHKVVVVSLVTKTMIDWATEPRQLSKIRSSDNSRDILIITVIYVMSCGIYRWADTCWIRNKGRGGIRQVTREFMMEKMMMARFQETFEESLTDSRWFYTAINDVHLVSIHIWWNGLMVIQNAFGLVLSMLMLIFLELWRFLKGDNSLTAQNLLPVLILVFIAPISFFMIRRRNELNEEVALERSKADEQWIESWSMLSHSSKSGSSLGVREVHAYAKGFKAMSQGYVKKMVFARDWREDTKWMTTWMGIVSYTVILFWGAFAVLARRAGEPDAQTLEVGQYTVLLRIFSKIGMYLGRLNNCYVVSRQGITGVQRMQKVMNLGLDDKIVDHTKLCVNSQSITLREVFVDSAFCQYGGIRMRSGAELCVPLGCLVRLKHSEETSLLVVSGLMGGVISVQSGQVIVPSFISRMVLMESASHVTGHLTVLDVLKHTGAPAKETRRLAMALGLQPDQKASDLSAGLSKLLQLAEALLRDPDMLILVHPLTFLSSQHKLRITCLLRLWQACGGVRAVLKRLSDGDSAEDSTDHAEFLTMPRTLIVSETAYMKKTNRPSDVLIDLDDALEVPKTWMTTTSQDLDDIMEASKSVAPSAEKAVTTL